IRDCSGSFARNSRLETLCLRQHRQVLAQFNNKRFCYEEIERRASPCSSRWTNNSSPSSDVWRTFLWRLVFSLFHSMRSIFLSSVVAGPPPPPMMRVPPPPSPSGGGPPPMRGGAPPPGRGGGPPPPRAPSGGGPRGPPPAPSRSAPPAAAPSRSAPP